MRMIMLALGAISLAGMAAAQSMPPAMAEFGDGTGFAFATDPQLDLADGGTIEFWVGPSWNQEPGYDPVILANNGPQGPSYLIAMLRGRDGLALVSGDDEAVVAYDFSDSALHHVAIVQLDEGSVIYIDGRLIGALDVGFKNLPSYGLWVASADGNAQQFAGAIGGLRIWGTAIEQQVLIDHALRDPFDEAVPHPDLRHLRGLADFGTGELFLTENVEISEE